MYAKRYRIVHFRVNFTVSESCLSSLVHNSFIHNCQNEKQPKCPSVDKWINKEVYSENGILFSTKNELSNHGKYGGKLNADY